jgi:uncharacterized YccA/Bax inhibitor family protein
MSNPVLNRALNNIEYTPSGVEVPQIATRKMTVEGTMNRTMTLFVVFLVAALVTWQLQLIDFIFPAMIVGLGLALWATFSKKIRVGVMLAYALVQGVFVGGISLIFETVYEGIVMTALSATLITAGIMFVAYRQRWIRVTSKFRQILTFALLGYMGFAIVNLLVAVFTGDSAYSSSIGWLIALAGVGLASVTLVLDFADIEQAAQAGVDADFEWRLAFGLMVTLIWMYIEILRLLAILRGND